MTLLVAIKIVDNQQSSYHTQNQIARQPIMYAAHSRKHLIRTKEAETMKRFAKFQFIVVMKIMVAYWVETSDYHNRLLQGDDNDYNYDDDDAGVGDDKTVNDDGKLINIDQDKIAEVIKGVAIVSVIVARDRFESGRSKDNDDDGDDTEE